MSSKKKALGRGLDTLIPPTPTQTAPEQGLEVHQIPLPELRPNINQPRSRFREEEIAELANSIREKGILQPLLVRQQHGHYEIVAGERRFRAAQALDMATVPCLVVNVSDQDSFLMALIENLQRQDLNAIEEAKAFQSLIGRFGLTQDEVAARVGKNRSTVANSVRLLNLPLDVQEDVLEGRLSAGHARAILQIPDAAKQRHLRNLIVAKGLSVREAEVQARAMTQGKGRTPPKPMTIDAQVRSLEEQFTLKLGLAVFIRAVTAESGKIEIPYHSLDDFQTIADFFGS
jgi:ParB family chromosome partitioning protein